MSPSRNPLEASYAFCRQVARRSRSSFLPSFLLLGGRQRRAMEALYTFFRLADDLADGPGPLAPRHQILAAWHQRLGAVLTQLAKGDLPEQSGMGSSLGVAPGFRPVGEGGFDGGSIQENGPQGPLRQGHTLPGFAIGGGLPLGHPTEPGAWDRAGPEQANAALARALPALIDTLRRFHIPVEHLLAFLEGVQMDLDGRRYQAFSELAEYCHRVASAVGLACLCVWGFRGPRAYEPARWCGLAVQLTNILRDLKEDAARGRVYLPLDEIALCGYSVEDLLAGVADARFDRLMAMQIDRVRQFYHAGADLMAWLEPAGRRVFGMMLDTYWRLFGAIARRPREVLVRRVSLSAWDRLRVAVRWTCLPPRRSALP